MLRNNPLFQSTESDSSLLIAQRMNSCQRIDGTRSRSLVWHHSFRKRTHSRCEAKHGLKVNFILWDDCGNVEPSLTFAPPIPGRHNSQMMMNPSHAIRDSEAEMTAHRERFGEYVSGVVDRFKDDRRISFWQLYNEEAI